MIKTIKQTLATLDGPHLIINNGSERGDYIPCEKIHWSMGKIHNGVQLMKTYYPFDPAWDTKQRISVKSDQSDKRYAWDFDYDDYDPYDLLETASITRSQFEEIKQHGADIHLTLTLDMSLNDDELRKVFRPLANFGKIYLRVNHEANGYWFRHNTQHTFAEVAHFFQRSHTIAKSVSSQIMTVFSVSADVFVGDSINSVVRVDTSRLSVDELGTALGVADFWSIDKYVTLNWGWPYTTPADSGNYFAGTIDTWWRLVEETYILMGHMNNGQLKPLFINEFNTDSDVVGEEGQADAIRKVYERIRLSQFPWLRGICLYQFCDKGGLGLVKGDRDEFTEMPSLSAYREQAHELDYQYHIENVEWPHKDFTFSWMDAENIRGLALEFSENANLFTNQFITPVYLAHGSSWHRVKPNEKFNLTQKSGFLFIPPSKKVHQERINFCHKIKNIRSTLQSMVS